MTKQKDPEKELVEAYVSLVSLFCIKWSSEVSIMCEIRI
jgi:hypothetical protein